jgi:hypothetical protein
MQSPVHNDVDVAGITTVSRAKMNVIAFHKAHFHWKMRRESSGVDPRLQLRQYHSYFIPAK